MTKLEQFIDKNISDFHNLGADEYALFPLNEFDDDVIEYIKSVDRFIHRKVAVYRSEFTGYIIVENFVNFDVY
jgi:hypothetical protein